MKLFKRPSQLQRQLAEAELTDAMAAVQPIPPGTLIFTSWSPKVTVAHKKSARNAGSVCEALSERTDRLGTGSDEERVRARALRLCHRCQMGDFGEAAS